MAGLEKRYRRAGDSVLIEVKVDTVEQLFNSLDPSPFRAKDLDSEVAGYIVDTAQEFPLHTPVRLAIHVPLDRAAYDSLQASVTEAIHNYFEYQSDVATAKLRRKLRLGRTSLVVGLLFLFVCLSARAALGAYTGNVSIEVIREGLLIMGWVAMWRPIQILLYDWWPIRGMRRWYDKLALMQVQIEAPVTGG